MIKHHKYIKPEEKDELFHGVIIKLYPVKTLYFNSKYRYYLRYSHGNKYCNIYKGNDGYRKYDIFNETKILDSNRCVEFVFINRIIGDTILHRIIIIDGVRYEYFPT